MVKEEEEILEKKPCLHRDESRRLTEHSQLVCSYAIKMNAGDQPEC